MTWFKKKAAPKEPEQFPAGYSIKFKFIEFDEEEFFSDTETVKYQWWLWKNSAVVDNGTARVYLSRDAEAQVRYFGIEKAKQHKKKWAQRARFPYTIGETYVID